VRSGAGIFDGRNTFGSALYPAAPPRAALMAAMIAPPSVGPVGCESDGEDRSQRRERAVDQSGHRGLHALKQERLLVVWFVRACEIECAHVFPPN